MPGPAEWIWILVLLVVLFGAKKLPELARSTGEALKEFKKATRDAMKEEDDTTRAAAAPPPVESQRRLEQPAAETTTTTTT